MSAKKKLHAVDGPVGIAAEIPSHLSKEDLALYLPVLSRYEATSEAVAAAKRQLSEAVTAQVGAQAVGQFVLAGFVERYGLAPNDQIDQAGKIIRAK